jgi:hypothetical protein
MLHVTRMSRTCLLYSVLYTYTVQCIYELWFVYRLNLGILELNFGDQGITSDHLHSRVGTIA